MYSLFDKFFEVLYIYNETIRRLVEGYEREREKGEGIAICPLMYM